MDPSSWSAMLAKFKSAAGQQCARFGGDKQFRDRTLGQPLSIALTSLGDIRRRAINREFYVARSV